MKKLMSLILFATLWSVGSRADQPATHGMLVFGGQTTYLSHLPMFHAPHNYQVILQAHLSGAAADSYNQLKTSVDDIFTIEPEKMDLTTVISGQKTEFSAKLFQGHFEKDGKLLGVVTVHVDKVITSAKLNPTGQPGQDYLVFGANGEYFAAHMIAGQPTYDAITKVAQAKSFPICHKRLCLDLDPVAVADSKLPITLGKSDANLLPNVNDELGLLYTTTKIQKIIYVEQNDLSM